MHGLHLLLRGDKMTIHKECLGCKWEDFPYCKGTKMFDGGFMNIENLSPNFDCGKKNEDEIMDLSYIPKTQQELKIEELENRIKILENGNNRKVE